MQPQLVIVSNFKPDNELIMRMAQIAKHDTLSNQVELQVRTWHLSGIKPLKLSTWTESSIWFVYCVLGALLRPSNLIGATVAKN